MNAKAAAVRNPGGAVTSSAGEPHHSALGAAIARVLRLGRRGRSKSDPRLDDTACAVYTSYGPFRIRSYHVAVVVREAFGGFLYQPKDVR